MKLRYAVLLLGALPCPVAACSICGGDLLGRSTMRQEAAQAKIVVAGKLANARLLPNAPDAGGLTDLKIERVIKSNPALKNQTKIVIPRYLPTDDKATSFLLLIDVVQDKLDVTAGRFIKDDRVFDYLKGVLELDANDQAKTLQYFFKFLDSPVPEIAFDAFLEFAKSTDAEVGQIARQLRPEPLRKLLRDPETPSERLRLYAFLLGGCGGAADAELLLSLIKSDTERDRGATSGLLAGYIVLSPREGWKLAAQIVGNPKLGFLERYAVLSTLRFFRGWKPNENGEAIRKVLAIAVEDGELADMAIEDLRRSAWWDLTEPILVKFGRKSHDTPMMKSAIVRYALSCPQEKAKQFVAELKKRDPQLVAGAIESLDGEK